jgi:hypothetical protein
MYGHRAPPRRRPRACRPSRRPAVPDAAGRAHRCRARSASNPCGIWGKPGQFISPSCWVNSSTLTHARGEECGGGHAVVAMARGRAGAAGAAVKCVGVPRQGVARWGGAARATFGGRGVEAAARARWGGGRPGGGGGVLRGGALGNSATGAGAARAPQPRPNRRGGGGWRRRGPRVCARAPRDSDAAGRHGRARARPLTAGQDAAAAGYARQASRQGMVQRRVAVA